MKARIGLLSVVTGFGFLTGAVVNYFHFGHTSKTVPSLVQEFVAGFGMLWLHCAGFLLAFGLLHFAAGWLLAWAVEPVATRLGRSRREGLQILFLLFLLAVFWVLLASAGAFPHSMLGHTLHDFATAGAGYWLKWAVAAVTVAAALAGLGLRLAANAGRYRARPARTALLLLGGILALAGWGWYSNQDPGPFPNVPEHPHVILVGIDGWRLDTLVANGGLPGVMPFVEEFMAEAAVVEEAVTPLARTFPAWWSVFTGQFPPAHGARFNLISDDFIRTGLTLPSQLGERGYHRLFAMDERRFANIREDHGFERVIGPGLGAADFLLGGLNDSPLGNLLANTRLARYLFPFTHANRAAYITYRPETFDRMLGRELARVPRQPLLLAVHFELPHWPFQWADGPTGKYADHPRGQEFGNYLETLQVADGQVARLFGELESMGILDNAIVVLLSDHGEAFPGDDRSWKDPETGRTVTTPVGHGKHVLGLEEYLVPLAFRRYGGEPVVVREVPGRASLADVYPTLAEWLGLETPADLDGQSLYPVLFDDRAGIPQQSIAIETGFNPDTTSPEIIDAASLFAEGIAYYRVTRDGRLELKPAEMDDLLRRKRRAVIRGSMILTPAARGSDTQTPRWLLADPERRETSEHDGVFPEDHPARVLAEDFCRIFAPDRAWRPPGQCNTGPDSGDGGF